MNWTVSIATAFDSWLSGLAPSAAVLLLTLGIVLIYVELNRPGSIVPGALGLLATLFAVAAIARHSVTAVGFVLVLTAVALLALDLLRPTPGAVAAVAMVSLVLGLRALVRGSAAVAIPVATSCGFALAAGTSLLTRIARRARVNKGLD